MKKRLSAVVVGAGVAGLLWLGGPSAQAACDTGSSNTTDTSDQVAPNPATGGEVYGAQNASGTGGYVGTQGGTGYIEAGGDATSGGFVQGSTTDGAVNGRVDIGTAPGVCVNDQP